MSEFLYNNKNFRIFLHVIVITIALSAYLFGDDLSQGRTITVVKDPDSALGRIIRDLGSGVLLGYLPYLILGWSKRTRPIAIYFCLLWVFFYAWGKFFLV